MIDISKNLSNWWNSNYEVDLEYCSGICDHSTRARLVSLVDIASQIKRGIAEVGYFGGRTILHSTIGIGSGLCLPFILFCRKMEEMTDVRFIEINFNDKLECLAESMILRLAEGVILSPIAGTLLLILRVSAVAADAIGIINPMIGAETRQRALNYKELILEAWDMGHHFIDDLAEGDSFHKSTDSLQERWFLLKQQWRLLHKQ